MYVLVCMYAHIYRCLQNNVLPLVLDLEEAEAVGDFLAHALHHWSDRMCVWWWMLGMGGLGEGRLGELVFFLIFLKVFTRCTTVFIVGFGWVLGMGGRVKKKYLHTDVHAHNSRPPNERINHT